MEKNSFRGEARFAAEKKVQWKRGGRGQRREMIYVEIPHPSSLLPRRMCKSSSSMAVAEGRKGVFRLHNLLLSFNPPPERKKAPFTAAAERSIGEHCIAGKATVR